MSKENDSVNRHYSRRDLLKTTVLAAGGATLAGLGACAKPHEMSVEMSIETEKPTHNMQLSLAAYSMRDALTSGQMDLFQFIDWCAEMDLQGTELTSYYFKKDFDNQYLHDLKLRAFRQGVTISGTAIGNNFCLPNGPERDAQLALTRKWIDNAAELTAPHIRIFAGQAPDGVELKTAIGWAADGIKESLDYAAQRGIVLGLENHGGITAKVEDHLAICDMVGEHPWFGINLDTGNYRTKPYEELELAAPRSVNVQIKVEVADENGNGVPADLARVRDILVKANYKGWVALEYEAAEDPKVAIPRYMKELKKLYLG